MNTFLQTGQLLLAVNALLFGLYLAKSSNISALSAILLLLGSQLALQLTPLAEQQTGILLNLLIAFSYGPLIWLLVRQICLPLPNHISIWWHTTGPVVAAMLWLYWPELTLWPVLSSSLLVYLVAAIWHLQRYQRLVLANWSDTTAIQVGWLRHLLAGFLLLTLLDACRMFGFTGQINGLDTWLQPLFLVAAIVLVYSLVWRALQIPLPQRGALLTATEPATDYPLDEAEQSAQVRLLQWMQTRQPYLDPTLTVQQLAEQLDWPVRVLSARINRQGTNFNDYINQFRVQHACQLLADPNQNNVKLIGVQLDAGFASKSVFNHHFKRLTGMTPGEYRRQHQPKTEKSGPES